METVVSYLVPCFNAERFVRSALCGIARQRYNQKELFVYDDGSTDRSAEVVFDALKQLANAFQRVVVERNSENRGKNAALNKLLRGIRGEYVVIHDADDVLEERYTDQCLSALALARKQDPAVAFVYTNCALIDEAGSNIADGLSHSFDESLLRTNSYIPDCALTSADVLLNILPLDETVRVGTKHYKWRRIVEAGRRGLHLEVKGFQYRMHQGNISGIGNRIKRALADGSSREQILSGYWPTEQKTGCVIDA